MGNIFGSLNQSFGNLPLDAFLQMGRLEAFLEDETDIPGRALPQIVEIEERRHDIAQEVDVEGIVIHSL